MEDMPEFYRDHQVQLVASLPCYLEGNVDEQRGRGTYGKSIEVISRLNRLGYGTQNNLGLDLVYNPVGPFLPAAQATLEGDYKRELKNRFGITFNRLLTITNMPIGRYRKRLRREDKLCIYMQLLKDAFNSQTVEALMCRRQISVGWDGRLYDCDFNLALQLPINHGAPNHIRAFEPARLTGRRIVTGDHCFGCTAGQGSSCGGSLA
jgi:radical SAM/Cys-rich protein